MCPSNAIVNQKSSHFAQNLDFIETFGRKELSGSAIKQMWFSAPSSVKSSSTSPIEASGQSSALKYSFSSSLQLTSFSSERKWTSGQTPRIFWRFYCHWNNRPGVQFFFCYSNFLVSCWPSRQSLWYWNICLLIFSWCGTWPNQNLSMSDLITIQDRPRMIKYW